MQINLIDDRGGSAIAGAGRFNDILVSEVMPRYGELARRGQLFMAQAIVTAPVVYTTAAGTGGPLLWNGSSNKDVVILAATYAVTVVTTVAAALGLTGNTGQPQAPTTATAIDGRRNLRLGGAASASTPFRIGTVAVAGDFLLPFASLHTGAITTETGITGWVDIGGALVVPPGAWCSIAASATASTTVAQLGLIYAEVPTL